MIYGYVRRSTNDDERQQNSLEVQRRAIRAWVEGQGPSNVEWREESASARRLDNRPVLTAVLAEIVAGDTLVVQRLDRLARSVIDGAKVIERAKKEKWNLVALDPGVDLSTPTGELIANVVLSVARWESRMLGERIRGAMTKLKSEGRSFGRQREIPSKVRRRIISHYDRCRSASEVAAALNDDAVPTARGGRWHHSTVRAVLMQEGKL
jgi:DNA invertase Pin-like site-specific DNA recombinase